MAVAAAKRRKKRKPPFRKKRPVAAQVDQEKPPKPKPPKKKDAAKGGRKSRPPKKMYRGGRGPVAPSTDDGTVGGGGGGSSSGSAIGQGLGGGTQTGTGKKPKGSAPIPGYTPPSSSGSAGSSSAGGSKGGGGGGRKPSSAAKYREAIEAHNELMDHVDELEAKREDASADRRAELQDRMEELLDKPEAEKPEDESQERRDARQGVVAAKRLGRQTADSVVTKVKRTIRQGQEKAASDELKAAYKDTAKQVKRQVKTPKLSRRFKEAYPGKSKTMTMEERAAAQRGIEHGERIEEGRVEDRRVARRRFQRRTDERRAVARETATNQRKEAIRDSVETRLEAVERSEGRKPVPAERREARQAARKAVKPTKKRQSRELKAFGAVREEGPAFFRQLEDQLHHGTAEQRQAAEKRLNRGKKARPKNGGYMGRLTIKDGGGFETRDQTTERVGKRKEAVLEEEDRIERRSLAAGAWENLKEMPANAPEAVGAMLKLAEEAINRAGARVDEAMGGPAFKDAVKDIDTSASRETLKSFKKTSPVYPFAKAVLEGGDIGAARDEMEKRARENPVALAGDLSILGGAATKAATMVPGRVAARTTRPAATAGTKADAAGKSGGRVFGPSKARAAERKRRTDRSKRIEHAGKQAQRFTERRVQRVGGEGPVAFRRRKAAAGRAARDRAEAKAVGRDLAQAPPGRAQSYSQARPMRIAQKARENARALAGRDPFMSTGRSYAAAATRSVLHHLGSERSAGAKRTIAAGAALSQARRGVSDVGPVRAVLRPMGMGTKGSPKRAMYNAAVTLVHTEAVRGGRVLEDLKSIEQNLRRHASDVPEDSIRVMRELIEDVERNGPKAVIHSQQVADAVAFSRRYSHDVGAELQATGHHDATQERVRIARQGPLIRGEATLVPSNTEAHLIDEDGQQIVLGPVPEGARVLDSANPAPGAWLAKITPEGIRVLEPEDGSGGYLDPLAADRDVATGSKHLGIADEKSASMESGRDLLRTNLTKENVRASLDARQRLAAWRRSVRAIKDASLEGTELPPAAWKALQADRAANGEEWTAVSVEVVEGGGRRIGESGMHEAGSNENAVLIPTKLVKALDRDLGHPGAIRGTMNWISRGFVSATLPFSVAWQAGNYIDLVTRLVVAGGNPFKDAELTRLVYRQMREGLGEDRAQFMFANQMGHLGSQSEVTRGSQLRFATANSKRKTIRAFGEAASRAYNDTRIGAPGRTLGRVKEGGFDVATMLERGPVAAASGRALRLLARELGIEVNDHARLAMRMVEAIDQDSSLIEEFARRTVEIVGDYSQGPLARRLQFVDPFFRWMIESNKFIFYHFPAKHPAKFALAAYAADMGAEAAERLGLEGYLEGTSIGELMELGGSGYLAGALPIGGGWYRPSSPFTSWGEAAKLLENPWEYGAGRLFPYFQGIGAALAGIKAPQRLGPVAMKALAKWLPEHTGISIPGMSQQGVTPFEQIEGGPLSAEAFENAAGSAIQTFVPGANQYYNMARGGGFPEGNIFDPQSRPGTEVPIWENSAINPFGKVKDLAQLEDPPVPRAAELAGEKAKKHKPPLDVDFVIFSKDGTPIHVTGPPQDTTIEQISAKQAKRLAEREGDPERDSDPTVVPWFDVDFGENLKSQNNPLVKGALQLALRRGLDLEGQKKVVAIAKKAAAAEGYVPDYVPEPYVDMIRASAKRWGVSTEVLSAQLNAESGFAEDVIRGDRASIAGAQGIAQFMPETAAAYGIDPLVPEQAIDGQAHYMADLLEQFDGDYRLAIAGYNAGGGAAYEALESYPETIAYVDQIMGSLKYDPAKGTPTQQATKLKGQWAGSQRIVRELIGPKYSKKVDWKDKEDRGYSSLHDIETHPNGFAADLTIDEGGLDTEQLVDRIAKKLGLDPQEVNYGTTGLESGITYKGYAIEFLPYDHGSGPHVHIGAEWTGEALPEGTVSGGATAAPQDPYAVVSQAGSVPVSGADMASAGRLLGSARIRRSERDLYLERLGLAFQLLRGELDISEYVSGVKSLERIIAGNLSG